MDLLRVIHELCRLGWELTWSYDERVLHVKGWRHDETQRKDVSATYAVSDADLRIVSNPSQYIASQLKRVFQQ